MIDWSFGLRRVFKYSHVLTSILGRVEISHHKLLREERLNTYTYVVYVYTSESKVKRNWCPFIVH